MQVEREGRIVWTKVGQGRIALGSRPRLRGLEEYRKLGCTTIASLQYEHEKLEELQRACEKAQLSWYNVAMRGANFSVLRANSGLIAAGLEATRERLSAGESVFIHCAWGVHRTGFFTYVLLRLHEFPQDNALTCIEMLRPRCYYCCGKFRFELAEQFVQQLTTGREMQIPPLMTGLEGWKFTDIVRIDDCPLLWLDISLLSDRSVALSFFITNSQLSKGVEGWTEYCEVPDLAARMSPLWMDTRTRCPNSAAPLKSLTDCESILMDFLKSSTEESTCTLAGMRPYLEADFLEELMPGVFKYLHHRVVDLSTFVLLTGEPVAEFPVNYLKRMKLQWFETTPRVVSS